MATKKKPAQKIKTPPGIPPVKKMIDLSQMDKTAKDSALFAKVLNTNFVKELKGTHIPVFDMLVQQSGNSLVQLYFLNYRRFVHIYSPGAMQIMNRAFKDAFVTTLLKQLDGKYSKGKACYPGLWTDSQLAVLVRVLVNIIVPLDRPELHEYLSVHQSENKVTTEQIAKWPAYSCMKFTDYNPNRLYQFACVCMAMLEASIANEIEINVPYALVCTEDQPVRQRYANEFKEYTKDMIQAWAKKSDDAGRSFDAKVAELADLIKTPVMMYHTRLLHQSGLSQERIGEMLDISNIAILYDIEPGCNSVGDLDKKTVKIQFLLRPKEEPREDKIPCASITFDLGDLYTLVMSETVSKSLQNKVGGLSYDFMTSLMRYTTYVCMTGYTTDTEESSEEEIPDTKDLSLE